MTCSIVDVSKGIAVSSLGLYAGLVTSSTIVSIIAPIDVIKNNLKHVMCAFGIGGSVLATISSVGFGLNYYLAPEGARNTLFICGLSIGPFTGLILQYGSYVSGFLLGLYHKKNRRETPDLPPSHPSIVGENGEVQKCPFTSGTNSEKSSTKGDSVITSTNINLMLATAVSVSGYIMIVLSI